MEDKDLNIEEENTEEVEDIEENIEEEKASEVSDELNQVKDQYLRLQAEFQNFKRRKEKEKETTVAFAIEGFVVDMLPTLDNFQRALASEEDKESGFYKGVELTYNSFKEILKKHNVEEIQALDEAFDPNYHHAVFKEEVEGLEPNIVIEELQTGYKLNDKVIRPTMVKVSE